MCCGQKFTAEGIQQSQQVIEQMARQLEADRHAWVAFRATVARLQGDLGVDIPPMTAHSALWEMELGGRERRLEGFRAWLKEHL